jgi:hypothetical protein
MLSSPLGFSADLALRKRSSCDRFGEPLSAPAACHLPAQAPASTIDRMGPLVLGRIVPSMEGMASSRGRGSSRHGLALAPRTFPAVLGEPLEAASQNRMTSDSTLDSRADSKPGAGKPLVASTARSRRAVKARHRHFRTNRIAHAAVGETATIADVEDLPAQPPGRDRRR